jgi:hypothetical protein
LGSIRHEEFYGREAYGRKAFLRRAVYSFLIVFSVLVIGTIGFHLIEHYSYVDAFYFISMLVTAQGPATTPSTTLGKLFASAMAFISVGAVVFALAFLFGPFFGKLLKIGEREFEKEESLFKKDVKKIEKKI